MQTEFTRQAEIEVPLICGAMFPCSNPELVAAVSEAGGIGIIQPVSAIFVYKYDFRESIRYIRTLTDKPIGLNLIVEKSSKLFERRAQEWLDIALEEGIRFFVTALGKPGWVVDKVKPHGGIVYHNVTERKWGEKALEGGVNGLNLVNDRSGGHPGDLSGEALFNSMKDLGVPLIKAGGIGDENQFAEAIKMGYAGVQLGTRFIASKECQAHQDYKEAIVKAKESDIVRTDKISGVPVAIINSPYIEKVGTKASAFSSWMLKREKTKHIIRLYYTLSSAWKLRGALLQGGGYKNYFQAGKSVHTIDKIESASEIVHKFASKL